MNLQEVYNDLKSPINYGYMEFYNTIRDAIDEKADYTLSDDEQGELIVDLMLSNVLGEITTFDEVLALLKANKQK